MVKNRWMASGLLICGLASPIEAVDSGIESKASKEAASEIVVENAILKTIRSADVAAQVSGILKTISVREGDRVTEGSALGRMHDEAVWLQIERAKIALETAKLKRESSIDLQVARKSAAVAGNELQRALRANQRVPDTYPTTEVDRLQLMADRSQLEIERSELAQSLLQMDVRSAENDLLIAQELAQRHQITAPCDGVVVAVDRRPGEWIELGGRLLQLVSIEKLRIEGFVGLDVADASLIDAEAEVGIVRIDGSSPESRRPAEKTASKVEALPISGETSSMPLKAKVVFVGPEANPVNGKVRVFLDIDNAQGQLHPGQRVDVRIRRAGR